MIKSIFPVKYGVLECDERINCSTSDLPSYFDIKAYIACKCFILSEQRKYKRDGKVDESYEVVFLYKKNDELFVRVEPMFSGDDCINKVSVKTLYSDFSLASASADELNRNAFKNLATTIPYDSGYSTKVKTAKQNHDKLLASFKTQEEQLENDTKDYNESIKVLVK